MVPLRDVAEILGYYVAWDRNASTVHIGDRPFTETGFVYNSTYAGNFMTNFDIIIGSGTDRWPYSESEALGGRAFEPIAGATYRITYNVTAHEYAWRPGWWVRWMTVACGNVFRGTRTEPHGTAGGFALFMNDAYTAADRENIRAALHERPLSYGEVATTIPAVFREGFTEGGTYTLVVEITLDGEQGQDGFIGNITLACSGGSSDWWLNWATIELLSDSYGSEPIETVATWQPTNSPDVVYSLRNDAYLRTVPFDEPSGRSILDGTPYLAVAASPTVTRVHTVFGYTAFRLSQREYVFQGIDIALSDFPSLA